MITKINSEYIFQKEVGANIVVLTLYINYVNKTYDFMQIEQEGIFPRNNNSDTRRNKVYFELGLEVLDFVEKELFNKDLAKNK